jgi:hypothetical protein
VKAFLCPTLAAGDSVVWDNLSAHAVAGVREAMEARGDPPVLDAMMGAALVEAMAFGRLAFACGAEAIREFLAVVGQDLCDREGAFSTKRNSVNHHPKVTRHPHRIFSS